MMNIINNRYRVLQALGKGGCGQTYLVEDTHLPSKPRRVIKKLKSATDVPEYYEVIKERFDREAAVLEELGRNTDRIPTLHAYFNEGDEFYLVQDWVEGKNLKQAVQEYGLFNENQVRNFLVAVLRVLEFVHSRGIIHRDIKPENIMVRARDGAPVLIDFGAVKEVVTTVIDSHGTPTSTIIIGTPGFMPLEQSAGRPIFASDLYSLGLTAIYLLTGKYPLDMLNRQTGEITWRQYAPALSPHLISVLEKAIEQNPRDRFLNARQMLAALQADDEPTLVRSKNRQTDRPPVPSSPPPGPGTKERFQPPAPRLPTPPPQYTPSPVMVRPHQPYAIEPNARIRIFLLYVVMRVGLAVAFSLFFNLGFENVNRLSYEWFGSSIIHSIFIGLFNLFSNLFDDLVLGSLQFLLLRKRLSLTPAWIGITVVCGLAASLVNIPFSFFINRRMAEAGYSYYSRSAEYLVFIALIQLFFPLFIAIGQWTILRKRIKVAWLWISVSVLVQFIYSVSYSLFSLPLRYNFRLTDSANSLLFSFYRGLLIGVAQAVCLLLFQKKEDVSASSTFQQSWETR